MPFKAHLRVAGGKKLNAMSGTRLTIYECDSLFTQAEKDLTETEHTKANVDPLGFSLLPTWCRK